MPRKAVSERLKSISRLRSAIRAHRGRLDRALIRRPAAPAGDGFSYRPCFDHFDAGLAGHDHVPRSLKAR